MKVLSRVTLVKLSAFVLALLAASGFTACDSQQAATPAVADPRTEPPAVESASTDHADGGRAHDRESAADQNPEAKPRETTTEQAEAKPHRANRLAKETSPYLRMHAHNPVDWYPWGEEALAKANREGKLIFLSVGYSSCYWCHVMERESFMDEEIARLLNEHFVCIKVDREERPDIDTIYMTAVQLITRRGGWPMSVFLTPAGQPFFGGTYFPARDGDRPGATGFLSVLRRVQEGWENQDDADAEAQKLTRADIEEYGQRLTDAIRSELRGQVPVTAPQLDAGMPEKTKQTLASQFDVRYGGFGFSAADPQRPKFPEPSNLLFLLDRCRQARDDEDSRRMLLTSLERMAMGGIWDHLGGGFHRYSVDRFWHVPHFEKMLYDNGQLLSVYGASYQLTQREDLRRVVDQTVAYLLRDMSAPGGAFYAALDAESEQVEGKSYRWTREEIREELGDDYELFASVYGLDAEPNFEEEFYVLQLSRPLSETAAEKGISETALEAQLAPLRQRLLTRRNQRVQPLTDTKILCSWNGLLIRGLADAGRFCNEPRYSEAAARAAQFVLDKLRNSDGRLLRTFSEGQAQLNAYLDDYAFLADGLIALHQATGDARWLKLAEQLTELQIELFWDEQAGGFFFTSKDHEALIARVKRSNDGALPSGNSVAAGNLLYLAEQLESDKYRQLARETVQSLATVMDEYPAIAPRASVVIGQLMGSPENNDGAATDADSAAADAEAESSEAGASEPGDKD